MTAVEQIVTTMEQRNRKSGRIWVMDRGMVSDELVFGRRLLLESREFCGWKRPPGPLQKLSCNELLDAIDLNASLCARSLLCPLKLKRVVTLLATH